MSTYYDLDSQWRDRSAYPNPCDYQITSEQVNTWPIQPRDVRAIPQNANERPLNFMTTVDVKTATLPVPRIELYAPNLITINKASGGPGWTVETLPDPDVVLADGDMLMTSSPGWATSNGIVRNTPYYISGLAGTPATGYTFTLHLVYAPLSPAIQVAAGTFLQLIMGHTPAADAAIVMLTLETAQSLINFPRIYLDIHSRRYHDNRYLKTIGGVLSDARYVLIQDRIQFDDNLQPLWIHYRGTGEQTMRFESNGPLVIRFMTRDGTTIPFFNEPIANGEVTNPYKQSMITINTTPFVRDASYTHHGVEPIS